MAVHPIHRKYSLFQKFSKDFVGKVAISHALIHFDSLIISLIHHSTLKLLIITKKLHVLIERVL